MHFKISLRAVVAEYKLVHTKKDTPYPDPLHRAHAYHFSHRGNSLDIASILLLLLLLARHRKQQPEV